MVTWLDYISIFAVLIPFLYGLFYYKTLSSYLRLFTFFLLFGFLLDLLNLYLAMNEKNNIWVMNIFLLVELPVLLYISLRISGLLKNLRYFLFFNALFVLFWLWWVPFHSSIFEFSNIVNGTVYFSLIVSSGYSLIKISEQYQLNILNNPAFWLNAGFIIYFSGSMAIFCLANEMVDSGRQIMDNAWIVNSAFTIISYLFYTIALVCTSKKPTA